MERSGGHQLGDCRHDHLVAADDWQLYAVSPDHGPAVHRRAIPSVLNCLITTEVADKRSARANSQVARPDLARAGSLRLIWTTGSPSAPGSDTITLCPRSRLASPLRVCSASSSSSSSPWPLEHRGAQPLTGVGLRWMTVGCRPGIGSPAPALRSFSPGPSGWYSPRARSSARPRLQRTFSALGLGSSWGCSRSIRWETSPGGTP